MALSQFFLTLTNSNRSGKTQLHVENLLSEVAINRFSV